LEWTNQKKEGNRQSQSYDTKREEAITGMSTSFRVNAYDNFKYDNQKPKNYESWIWCEWVRMFQMNQRASSLIALTVIKVAYNRFKISNHFGFTKCYF
jgi:hypothetical protein